MYQETSCAAVLHEFPLHPGAQHSPLLLPGVLLMCCVCAVPPVCCARGPTHMLHVVLLGGSNQRCLLWVLSQRWLLLLLAPLVG